MSTVKRMYFRILFVITKGKQLYQTGASLTQEEADSITRLLDQYCKLGIIEQKSIFVPSRIEFTFETVVDELMKALEGQVGSVSRNKCDNCYRIWPAQMLNPVKDLLARVAPGEIMPSGECPICGAVCHPIKPVKK